MIKTPRFESRESFYQKQTRKLPFQAREEQSPAVSGR